MATFRVWRKLRLPFLPSMDPNTALLCVKNTVIMTVHTLPITPCDSVSVLVSCGEVYFRIRHWKAPGCPQIAWPGCPNLPCLGNCLGRVHLSRPGDTLRMSCAVGYKSVPGSRCVWKCRQLLKMLKMEPLGWLWCWFERRMLLCGMVEIFKETSEKGDLVSCFLLISSTSETPGGISETVQNQVSAECLKLQPEQELTVSESSRVTPAAGVCQTLRRRDPVLP